MAVQKILGKVITKYDMDNPNFKATPKPEPEVDGNVVENIKGTYDQNVTGNATMDAATINLNSGTKGAARLDDTVDTGDDPAGISGSDGSNKIETSSTTVIIGD